MLNHLPTFHVARRRRKFLAVYIDLMLLTILGGLVTPFLPAEWNNLLYKMAVFTVLEVIFFNTVGSPGYRILGMVRVSNAELLQHEEVAEIGELKGEYTVLVRPLQKETESWLTLLTGVLMIISANKRIIHWGMGAPLWPMFGASCDSTVAVIFNFFFAAAFVAGGLHILALRRAGFWIAAGAILVYTAGSLFDLELTRECFQRYAEFRAQLRGRPVPVDVLQKMLPYVPHMVIGGALINLTILAIIRRRLVL